LPLNHTLKREKKIAKKVPKENGWGGGQIVSGFEGEANIIPTDQGRTGKFTEPATSGFGRMCIETSPAKRRKVDKGSKNSRQE